MRVRSVAAALGAAALLLSGCGGGESPGADPAPLVTESEGPNVPEGVPTGPPPEPPAEQTNTRESAEEFTKFFLETYYYVFSVRDAEPLLTLVPDAKEQDCTGCPSVKKVVAEINREGRYSVVDGSEIEVKDSQELLREGRHLALSVVYDQPSGVRVEEEAGGPVGKTKPEKDRYLEIVLTWTGESWEVWEFAFPTTS